MRRINLWAVFIVGLVFVFVVPAARADQFQLNVDYTSSGVLPLGGSGGTVTLTQTATNTVDVTVQLSSGFAFHDQGLASFAFNVVGVSTFVSTDFSIINNGGSGWTFEQPGHNADGAGSFMYSFECTAGSNKCAGTPTVFEFTVTKSGLLLSMFETTNGGASNVDFAANVSIPSGSGCTGMIGGGNGTSPTSPSGGGRVSGSCITTVVPEPASITFFGAGLLGLGFVLRRRFGRPAR